MRAQDSTVRAEVHHPCHPLAECHLCQPLDCAPPPFGCVSSLIPLRCPAPPRTHHQLGLCNLQLLLHQARTVLVAAEGVQVATQVLQGKGWGWPRHAQEPRAEAPLVMPSRTTTGGPDLAGCSLCCSASPPRHSTPPSCRWLQIAAPQERRCLAAPRSAGTPQTPPPRPPRSRPCLQGPGPALSASLVLLQQLRLQLRLVLCHQGLRREGQGVVAAARVSSGQALHHAAHAAAPACPARCSQQR